MIQATHLTKRYGREEALSDFSLDVAAGEIVALVGPNGAGKTTALKLLVGLLTPTSGDAFVDGHHVVREPMDTKRVLAFVPDQPFLYETLTVAETLSFVAGMYELSAQTLRKRAQGLLELFGLLEHRHRRVGQLSYGMKSRLVLLASLLREPKALILDEPFFGLDPQTLVLMKRLLKERAARGMAILLSTHQLFIVEDLADRVAVLRSGQIVALGSCEQLTRQHGGGDLEAVFLRLTGGRHAP